MTALGRNNSALLRLDVSSASDSYCDLKEFLRFRIVCTLSGVGGRYLHPAQSPPPSQGAVQALIVREAQYLVHHVRPASRRRAGLHRKLGQNSEHRSDRARRRSVFELRDKFSRLPSGAAFTGDRTLSAQHRRLGQSPVRIAGGNSNLDAAIRDAGYRTSLFGKSALHRRGPDLRKVEHVLHSYGLDDVDEIRGPRASVDTICHMTARWDSLGLLDAFREDIKERAGKNKTLVRPSPLPLAEYYDVYVGQQAKNYLRDYNARSRGFAGSVSPGRTNRGTPPEPYASVYRPGRHAGADQRPRVEIAARKESLIRKSLSLPARSTMRGSCGPVTREKSR